MAVSERIKRSHWISSSCFLQACKSSWYTLWVIYFIFQTGAAVAVELTEEEKEVYELKDKELTPQALAYLRARNADPM